MKYIVFDGGGKILRTGQCAKQDLKRQGEHVIEGEADDLTQKIVDGKIVDKTSEEIEADNPTPPEIPDEHKPAVINKGQWQDVLYQLKELKTKA